MNAKCRVHRNHPIALVPDRFAHYRQATPESSAVPTHDEVMTLIHQEARAGARQILQAALVAEVEEHVKQFSELIDTDEPPTGGEDQTCSAAIDRDWRRFAGSEASACG